jgi:protein involved in plasmid replication-relaxation
MNGNRSVLITDRDRHLLRELATAKILDREMIQAVCGFPSVNRANDRLLRLHGAGLLRRHSLGTEAGGRKALYSLSAKGAECIGQALIWKLQRPENSLLIGDYFSAHQSAINWVWIAAKFRSYPSVTFLRWLSFPSPISDAIPLSPDGYFELRVAQAVHSVFVEVDLGTETARVWEKKIALYLRLATSGDFAKVFQQPRFKVAVVTSSERRQQNLRRIAAKQTTRIFFFNLLESIKRDGLLTSSWLRPTEDAQHLIA